MKFRSTLAPLALAAGGLLALLPALALAQTYPVRPITLIVPFPAGGSVDMMNRVTAEKLGTLLGQTVITDFRPGAGGNVGAEAVAKAKPDGYTIGFIAMPHLIGRSVYPRLGYDLMRDLEPVGIYVETVPVLVVHPSLGVKSVKELVELARSQPGKLEYGTGGNGTSAHLLGELFKRSTGTDLLHVPYKGAAAAVNDLVAGRVKVMYETASGAVGQIRAGRIVPLAVMGTRRSAALPEVPTIAEAGFPGLEFDQWGALMVPAGTPKAVIERLNAALKQIAAMPDVQKRFAESGATYVYSTPEEMATQMARDAKTIQDIVKAANITVE